MKQFKIPIPAENDNEIVKLFEKYYPKNEDDIDVPYDKYHWANFAC